MTPKPRKKGIYVEMDDEMYEQVMRRAKSRQRTAAGQVRYSIEVYFRKFPEDAISV